MFEQLHAFQMILWNEIKNILPDEMPENTISRSIVSYRNITSFLVPNISNAL